MAGADELQYRELILLLLNSDDVRNNTIDASIERRGGFVAAAASALCCVVISVPCVVPDGSKVVAASAKIGYGLLAQYRCHV